MEADWLPDRQDRKARSMIGYDRELTRAEDDLLHGFSEMDDSDVPDCEVGDWCCNQCGVQVGRWHDDDGTEQTSRFYGGGCDIYCVKCWGGDGW